MSTESLLSQSQITERKLFKVRGFLRNSTKPEWMDQRVKGGNSKATGYIISKQLEKDDFMAFAKNAARVARMNKTLRAKANDFGVLLTDLDARLSTKPQFAYIHEPEDTHGVFGDLEQNPVIANYLAVTENLKRLVIEPFLPTREAHRILTIGANYHPGNHHEQIEFRNQFAGAVWEYIAFQYLKEQLSDHQFLITPEQTFLLYRNIYPDRISTHSQNFNLSSGLQGQTMPDGLIIEEKEDSLSVEAAVEYKSWTRLNGHEGQLEAQVTNFKNGQLSRDLKLEGPNAINPLFHSGLIHLFTPGLSKDKPLKINPNSTVILVLPDHSKVSLGNAQNKYVPLSGKDFGIFVDVLLNSLRYMDK